MSYLTAFKQVRHAIGDAKHPNLQAVHIHAEDDETSALITTDGHHLAYARTGVPDRGAALISRTVAYVSKGKKKTKIKNEEDVTRYLLESPDNGMPFPDWKQVVPKNDPIAKVEVDRKELIRACKLIEVANSQQTEREMMEHKLDVIRQAREVASAEIEHLEASLRDPASETIIKAASGSLAREKGKLKTKKNSAPSPISGVIVNTTDAGIELTTLNLKRHEVIPCPPSKSTRFGLDVNYLIEALESMRDDKRVTLEVRDAYTPIIIRCVLGFELIMPIRLP